MLPPPTTKQSSCPASLACLISSARRAAVSGSMPNCPSPINASPESFRRIRLKRGRGIRLVGPIGWRSGERWRTLVRVRHPAKRPESRLHRWRCTLRRGNPARGGEASGGLADARGRGDFGREVAFLLLDRSEERRVGKE